MNNKDAVKKSLITLTVITLTCITLFLYTSVTVGYVTQVNSTSICIQYPTGIYKSAREDLTMHQYIITLVNDRYNLYIEYPINHKLSQDIYNLLH